MAWSINPHMRVGSVEPRRAVRQHARFVRTLRASGATIDVVPFVHGAFDSVFSKDNAVVLERRDGQLEALLARPKHDERRGEQHARATALSALGIVPNGGDGAPFEGGDLVILPGVSGAFLGHGFRSSNRAVTELEKFLDCGITSLELRDPRLYHLDMALSILDDGTAFVCAEALTTASLRAVEAHRAITSVVRVPLREALSFGVNVVQVARTVIMAGTAPMMAVEIRTRGYRVRRVALDQFHRAGGSAACLVSRVHVQRPTSLAASPPEPREALSASWR